MWMGKKGAQVWNLIEQSRPCILMAKLNKFVSKKIKYEFVLWANNHASVSVLAYLTALMIKHHNTSNITYISINLTRFAHMHTHTHTHTHFDSTMWTPLTRLMWIDFFLTHLAYLSTIQIYHVIFQIIDCILILRLIRIKSVFLFRPLQPIAGRKGKIEHWRQRWDNTSLLVVV